MGSRYDRKRMNVEGDRLSNLPDDLICKILSFMEIRHAIKTSVLSSRWRYIWTSVPSLNFSNVDFHTLGKFSKFVTHVLSGRNNQIEVFSVNLSFHEKVSQALIKRILKYASSHNVQQLNVTSLYRKKIEFPLSIFSSQSLIHLTLTGCEDELSITTSLTWEMPALETLNLHRVKLNEDECAAGLFSNCANLKNLTLKSCRLMRLMSLNGFKICHPGLSSLTLVDGCKGVNVVTPQLKNLTIKDWPARILISAPNLSSLHYKDKCYYYNDDGDHLELFGDLLYLEKVDLCVKCSFENKAYACKIVCLLQQLHAVKFLTLNLELVKLLSSSMELISHQPSPFTNLKSLKIYPFHVNPEEQTPIEVIMSTEVKNYLLDGSPGTMFTMVSHEEIRAVMNATSVRNLMGKLQVLLDQWKESSVTNIAHMKQDKTQLDTKMKRHFWERIACIESYWEDLSGQYKKGLKYTRLTISMLRKIQEVITKLPASSRVKLQARFSVLHAEAETIMDSVMDRMKIQCNMKPSQCLLP